MTGYLYRGTNTLELLNSQIRAGRKPDFDQNHVHPFEWAPDRIEHGTAEGWKRHRATGHTPCQSCAQWASEHPGRAR